MTTKIKEMKEIIGSKELQSLITEKEFVFVKFTTEWCGPCRSLSSLMQKEVLPTYQKKKNIAIVEMDLDKKINQKIAKKYKIGAVPAIMVWYKGEIVEIDINNKKSNVIMGYRQDIRNVFDTIISACKA